MAKQILILALLGDPTLPAGIPHTGGFNQTLRELLTAIAAFHFPICVITDTSSDRKSAYDKISDNIKLFRVEITPEEHNEQERLRTSQDRILKDIYNVLGDEIDDVVLIHSFYWFSGYIATCIHKQHNIPFIHTPISLAYNKIIAGYPPNCSFQVDCEPVFLNTADRILAITEQESNILVGHYQVEKTRVIVTGRTVDAVFHHPARDYSGQPAGTAVPANPIDAWNETDWWSFGAYTYLGRMVPIKGLLEIVQAWKKLYDKYGDRTPPLWLVGGTPTQIMELREKIAQKMGSIADCEAAHKIVWWGYLDQPSISALFLKTLALVTHSRFEPGGRMVLEAMCQGRPVIATPNGFAADYIRDWENGFLVPYGDYDLLAHRMEHFIYQPYLAYTMGVAAKTQFYQMEHKWNYIEVHKKLYESYLNCHENYNRTLDFPHTGGGPDARCLDEVDCFPYYRTQLSEQNWRRALEQQMGIKIGRFHSAGCIHSHAHHYMIEVGNHRFRVKQFYCRLNQNALWNWAEKQKVIWSGEQFQAAIQSSVFHRVLSPVAVDEGRAYYVLPEVPSVLPDYEQLCRMLNEFSKPTTADTPLDRPAYRVMVTLKAAIQALESATQSLDLPQGKQLLVLPSKIKELVEASNDDARFGINYGKTLEGHTVSCDGQIMLLPSCDWYWGELGPDQISAAMLFSKIPQPLPGQKNNLRILLWDLIMAWKRYLETAWCDPGAAEKTFESIHYALDRLKITL